MLTDLALRNLKPRATLSKLLTAMACTWPFCRRAPFPSGGVLRSLEQNRGELSNVLAKEMPVLRQPGVWAEIVEAVTQAFQD